MTDLPDPPIPAEVTCAGLPYMPLKVNTLLRSDLAELATGAEFKAAVLLWCTSWEETPAGSIPDNDRKLAKFVGVSLEQFSEIREMALRGFIACSDGRLYHPIICDLALTAWQKRRKNSESAALRWKREIQPKNANVSKTDAVARENPSVRTAKPMQGKVRKEKVRDSPLIPPQDACERIGLDFVIRVVERGENKIPVTLIEFLEAEEAGENNSAAYPQTKEIRNAEVWAASKAILQVYGLDKTAAGKVVGEMVKKHDLDVDEVAKAALGVWKGKPRAPKPYFVSVCERIALERRN